MARCDKCKAVLCKECIRGSDRCPRCNNPLRAAVEPGERRKPAREHRGPDYDEEPEEDEERPRSKERGPERPQKKKRDEEEDISRL